MRVVLYVEGSGERGVGVLPAPGHPLAQALEGAGHVLVRRLLESLGVSEVHFDAPLRTPRGRQVKGSDLKNDALLPKLLTWPRAELRPELVVLLVDDDGDTQLRSRLPRVVENVPLPHVFGIATKEFEAWLLSDMAAVRAVLGGGLPEPPDPEGMPPREAKRLLQDWMGSRAREAVREARVEIARRSDVERAGVSSRSFAEFRNRLRAVLGTTRP